MNYAKRLARTQEMCTEAGLGAFIVPPSPDLVYLTGYDPLPLERATLLVVRQRGDPVLVVPELERPLAEARAGELVGIVSWTDAEDPYALVAGSLPGTGRLAVGDRLWASHLLGISAAAPGVELEASSRALSLVRAVKDGGELDLLTRAAQGTDAALEDVLEEPLLGRTELDVAGALGAALRAHDHESVGFTIVGSGENAASPHHEPGNRRLAPSDAVVIDFGGRVGGYCSDMTRTLVIGDPEPELAEVHEVVLRAHDAGVRAVRPGVTAGDVDRACREVIRQAGYGERFIHRTGHGIGLEEHEPPWINAGNQQLLREGMTFSVEPGIYLPDRFGVRIEDIVAVTKDGARSLNEAPRALRSVS